MTDFRNHLGNIWVLFVIEINSSLMLFWGACVMIEFGVTEQAWRKVFYPSCLWADSSDRPGFGPHVCVSHWWDRIHFFRGWAMSRGVQKGYHPQTKIFGVLARPAEDLTYLHSALNAWGQSPWDRKWHCGELMTDMLVPWEGHCNLFTGGTYNSRGTECRGQWEQVIVNQVRKQGRQGMPTVKGKDSGAPWKQQIPKRF